MSRGLRTLCPHYRKLCSPLKDTSYSFMPTEKRKQPSPGAGWTPCREGRVLVQGHGVGGHTAEATFPVKTPLPAFHYPQPSVTTSSLVQKCCANIVYAYWSWCGKIFKPEFIYLMRQRKFTSAHSLHWQQAMTILDINSGLTRSTKKMYLRC